MVTWLRKREVRLGRREPGFVEITKGIAAGDRVVVEGTVKLRDGAAVHGIGRGQCLSRAVAASTRGAHDAFRTVDPRPVFATVLSLLLLIVGIMAALRLSIREYPDVSQPVVSINVNYRGANAAVIETRITQVHRERGRRPRGRRQAHLPEPRRERLGQRAVHRRTATSIPRPTTCAIAYPAS